MATPKTYLYVAPHDADNLFGASIMAHDLVSGLRRINPNIVADLAFPSGVWSPGLEASEIITCLWLGHSRKRKITGFSMGPVPEYTQIDQHGTILQKGWRAIFERCIRMRACSRFAIERQFHVDLTTGGKDKNCVRCLAVGVRRKAFHASETLCGIHNSAVRGARRAVAHKQAVRDALHNSA